MADSRITIFEQLDSAVDEGHMENIRAILNQKDQNGLDYDGILCALCNLGFPGNYEKFEQPIEACNVLYEGLSESGKEMRLPSSITERTSWSPLHSAGKYGRKDMVKFLVEKGYDVNRRDNRGQTPLSVAADPMIKEVGADNFEICKMLLENGALPNSVDIYGRTPIYGAARCYNTDLIRLLVEEYHVTPTQEDIKCAIARRGCHREDILSVLLQHGGCPLHLALRQVVRNNNKSVCKCLVELGADPFLVNTNDTWSPFQLAASLDDMSILRYFLNLWNKRFLASNTAGGNKNNHRYSDSPIHVLCRYPHVSLQAIKLLVEEFKANVSQPAVAATTVASAAGGEHHTTATLFPLHLAVMSNVKLDVLYYLLRLHPDALTEAQTARGK